MTDKKKSPRLADNPSPSVRNKLIAFAHYYRGGEDGVRGNATECYLLVHPGCSRKTAQVWGCNYLKHPIVQGILAESADRLSEDADITEQYVLSTIKDTVERCRQARPVMKNGEQVLVETEDGEMVPAFVFDASNVLKGSELLGKYKRMFVERSENTNISMTHEEWLNSLK